MKQLDSYHHLATEFYDLRKPHATSQELEWYLDYALQAQGPILEPMCGTGRYVIPMLERRFDIEGFDASEHMLKALHDKCAPKNITPNIQHCFFQDFRSMRKYALIFIPTGSFGLITDINDVKHCLHIIRNQLTPKGVFVFEVDTPYALADQLNEWNRSVYTKPDGTQIIGYQRPSFNSRTALVTIACHYEHKNKGALLASQSETVQVRLYQRYEIDALLNDVGFSFVTYKAYNKILANEFDSTLIYECRIK